MAGWHHPSEHAPLFPYADPDGSPFRVPATEGLPYRKGSDEDMAIRRILARTPAEPSWVERLKAWLRR